ncbi:alpha/beta hydrolase [Prosthecobacter sp.]|uniref:alpha/beta hydrolase n=1 Tax=Prosthecobacter sp. TaxID=1965333 RepID=UPI0024883771|nr:alpha/beta hydrolase [Prosthecobacter sp.]MDI1310668.1 alpha/beta hydrolase [Prosthecobacter sp.]
MKHIALLLSLVLALPCSLRAEEPLVIHLWDKGAPGFEKLRDEPEVMKGSSVTHVNNPSITVFPAPKDKANGAAMLIVPGGGHRQLGFGGEGVEPAKLLNELGVTCFVLKHRLPREEGSPYNIDIHPKQDGQRAMRVIRSRAAEWNLDPKRIGIIGFSAGGEVVAMVVYSPTAGDASAADPIDRESSRADFQVSIYPGPLGVPAGAIPADAPPAFFLVANDDTSHVKPVLDQVAKYEAAKLPVEVHLYARGGHGFGMGTRSKLASIKTWTQRMSDWLVDNGFLAKEKPKAGGK